MNSVLNKIGDNPSAIVWLRRLLLAGLTALAVWLAVRLIIGLVTPTSLYEPVLIGSATPVQTASGPVNYDFSYNPFAGGEADPVITAEPNLSDDAPETTLNLQLNGLRAGSNGSAFIRTPNGEEDNFYIGQEIMSGVILRGVFPNHVLIDVNGQMQRLTTEDAKAARANGGRNSSGALSRQGLQTLRAPDATSFLSQVQIIPAFDIDMNRVGIKLKPRSAGVDLGSYGLTEYDIVTRIGGQSLASGLPDLASLRRVITPGRPVSVDIVRNGQPQTITIGSSQ